MAIDASKKFLRDMYGDELIDVRLEEVELAEDGSVWRVTLGFYRRPGADMAWAESLGIKPQREYKRLEVFADTGEVIAMKIREAG